VTDDEVQKVAWLLAQFEWVELVERARTEQ
jgi:hypothetical protein